MQKCSFHTCLKNEIIPTISVAYMHQQVWDRVA
jgi:hypothetical protein